MKRILFESNSWSDIIKQNKKERKIFNFLNQHDLYYFHKSRLFRKALCDNKNVHNFIDGFIISLYLSCKHFKRIKRIRGPTFVKEFLSSWLSGKKKHFFVGLEEKDKKILIKKFPRIKNAKIYSYNPPYIKHIKFPKKEIKKISRLINKFNPDCVWVCIGSPKQNILSMNLFRPTKAKYFFNVGAALDFILEKKKEAPRWIRKLGLEWLYRLITDFRHSRRKVWKSFVAVLYLFTGKVNVEIKK